MCDISVKTGKIRYSYSLMLELKLSLWNFRVFYWHMLSTELIIHITNLFHVRLEVVSSTVCPNEVVSRQSAATPGHLGTLFIHNTDMPVCTLKRLEVAVIVASAREIPR